MTKRSNRLSVSIGLMSAADAIKFVESNPKWEFGNEEHILACDTYELFKRCLDIDGSDICEECEGTGEVECGQCDGSGTCTCSHRHDCEECDGSGAIDCEECDGGHHVLEEHELKTKTLPELVQIFDQANALLEAA